MSVALCYIAGPYTAEDPWLMEQNIRRAEELGREVMLLGAWPVVPHSNTRGYFVKACTYEQAIAGTMEMLRRCDVVLFTPDWQSSRGARGEYEEALRIGKPIAYTLPDLRRWLDELAGRGQR